MLCAIFLRAADGQTRPGRIARVFESGFAAMLGFYRRTLIVALGHPAIVMFVLAATVGLNVVLFVLVPKGFFPQQDTGALIGGVQGELAKHRRVRPGRVECGRVHRRAGDEYRQRVHIIETAVAAPFNRGPGDRAAAQAPDPGFRGAALFAGGSGY
jgi:hypothetical protein